MSTSSNVHSDSETEESADYRPNHSLDDSLVKPEENNKNKQPEETANSVSSIIQSVLQTRFGNTLDAIKSGSAKLGLAVMVWGMGYFNFSLLWLVCGVSIGMFISEKVRRRKATSEVIKASSDDPKKFAETVKEMFRLNGKEAPSWIYFPDMEKAEWLNRILQQMWPYISDYVKNLVTDKIQSSIQMSSSLLSGFSFTEVDLGNRAPRIAGVKVYGDTVTRRNEIIMDMQIVYDSESNIGVSVNGLQAGISSLIIRGVLRVQLSPLIEKMPIIGAASVSFVRDPTIDFDLTHLANIFDFPGLDSMLRGAVSDCVASLLVLPEKYIVKLSPDVDISRLRFPLPQGILRVEVIEAKNLMEKDKKFLGIGGSSDPYVNVKGTIKPILKFSVLLVIAVAAQ